MGNMSYCRFENTSSDLQDCVDHWDSVDLNDEDASDCEKEGKKKIIALAREILENEGFEINREDED